MKYMLLIYNDGQGFAAASEAEQGQLLGEYFAFTKAIVDSKEHVAGDPLQGIETATTVRVRDGGEDVLLAGDDRQVAFDVRLDGGEEELDVAGVGHDDRPRAQHP